MRVRNKKGNELEINEYLSTNQLRKNISADFWYEWVKKEEDTGYYYKILEWNWSGICVYASEWVKIEDKWVTYKGNLAIYDLVAHKNHVGKWVEFHPKHKNTMGEWMVKPNVIIPLKSKPLRVREEKTVKIINSILSLEI